MTSPWFEWRPNRLASGSLSRSDGSTRAPCARIGQTSTMMRPLPSTSETGPITLSSLGITTSSSWRTVLARVCRIDGRRVAGLLVHGHPLAFQHERGLDLDLTGLETARRLGTPERACRRQRHGRRDRQGERQDRHRLHLRRPTSGSVGGAHDPPQAAILLAPKPPDELFLSLPTPLFAFAQLDQQRGLEVLT